MKILYSDEHIVAIHKPAGLLVHRSAIDRQETEIAMIKLRDQIGHRVYPAHRLDKPVSGVLLFALNPENARQLARAFETGSVHKTYHALVRGHCPTEGKIDYPLKEQLDALTDQKADPHKLPQTAITEWQCLGTCELPIPVGRYSTARYSLLKINPSTGRKHQIRRHMKHIFHPIIGDTTHGDGRHNQMFRQQFGSSTLMLAATRLELQHPVTRVSITLGSDGDPSFRRILELVGLPFTEDLRAESR